MNFLDIIRADVYPWRKHGSHDGISREPRQVEVCRKPSSVSIKLSCNFQTLNTANRYCCFDAQRALRQRQLLQFLLSHFTLMVEQEWALSDEQRAETVTRITQSIANLAFSQGRNIDDAEAQETANKVEKKAYTVAHVESRTTTGIRPHSDSLKAYTRHVSVCSIYSCTHHLHPTAVHAVCSKWRQKQKHSSACLTGTTTATGKSYWFPYVSRAQHGVVRNLANLVLAAAKGQPKAREVAQEHGGKANAAELNLLGDREFLTSDSAREALGPMLAPDSAITKVIGDACTAVNLDVYWKAVAPVDMSWLCGFAAGPSCLAWLPYLLADEQQLS